MANILKSADIYGGNAVFIRFISLDYLDVIICYGICLEHACTSWFVVFSTVREGTTLLDKHQPDLVLLGADHAGVIINRLICYVLSDIWVVAQ